jgi:divalent metal cation (Fe/Co/Zn/Cd) transporter
VATLLARESKGLLIGERARPDVIACVRTILERRPEIVRVNHVRTIHTAPERIFVAVSADFRDDITMGAGETLIESIEQELKAALPMLSSIYIRPEKAEDAPDVVAVG